MESTGHRVHLSYALERSPDTWDLQEGLVPDARMHDLASSRLCEVLTPWASRQPRALQVGRNLALRWDPARPAVGVDPDVYIAWTPPEGDAVTSLRTWEPGHHPLLLAVEVVSPQYAHKDYVIVPDKYAASGTGELWVFDPLLAGPRVQGGPFRLQLWVRAGASGRFERVYAGAGPMRSPLLGAWVVPVDEGAGLRVTEDEEGTRWWLTATEAERAAKEAALAAKEAERAAKEAERAAKEAALARLAELEAQLAAIKGAT